MRRWKTVCRSVLRCVMWCATPGATIRADRRMQDNQSARGRIKLRQFAPGHTGAFYPTKAYRTFTAKVWEGNALLLARTG